MSTLPIHVASSLVYGITRGNITSLVNVTLQQATNAKMFQCNGVFCSLYIRFLKNKGESVCLCSLWHSLKWRAPKCISTLFFVIRYFREVPINSLMERWLAWPMLGLEWKGCGFEFLPCTSTCVTLKYHIHISYFISLLKKPKSFDFVFKPKTLIHQNLQKNQNTYTLNVVILVFMHPRWLLASFHEGYHGHVIPCFAMAWHL